MHFDGLEQLNSGALKFEKSHRLHDWARRRAAQLWLLNRYRVDLLVVNGKSCVWPTWEMEKLFVPIGTYIVRATV